MFLPIQCKSINKLSELTEVTLTGWCSQYRSLDGSADVLFCEYEGVQSKVMVACDLMVYTRSGEIYMHDFLLLNDGNWRNAFGSVAASLEALLPDIVLTAQLRKREAINEIYVKGNNV
jgi:hypothetical protein